VLGAGPIVEGLERVSVVQVRGVDLVAGTPQLVGESEEALGLPLCVVK